MFRESSQGNKRRELEAITYGNYMKERQLWNLMWHENKDGMINRTWDWGCGLKCYFYSQLAVEHWANNLPSLCFSFLIYQVKIVQLNELKISSKIKIDFIYGIHDKYLQIVEELSCERRIRPRLYTTLGGDQDQGGVQGSSEMATWRVEGGGWSNKLPHKREYSRRAERANFMML